MQASKLEARPASREIVEVAPVLGWSDHSSQQQEVSFAASRILLAAVSRQGWKILAGIALTVLSTYVASKYIPPMYDATTTLEINRDRPAELLGPEAVRASSNDADQYIATQLRVIQEDSVLRPVVRQFDLAPNPENDPNAPIVLKKLQVTRPPNTYLMQINYRSRDRAQASGVANAIANSYLRYVFQKKLDDRNNQTRFMENQLDELRGSMEKSTQAVNEFERQLGVVDPQEKTNIVSARLLQLNTEYTSAQADRIKSEADYDGVKNGSLSAATQADHNDSLKRLESQRADAQQKFTEIREHFGTKHPEFQKQESILKGIDKQIEDAKQNVMAQTLVSFQDALHRESILKAELTEAKKSFDELNAKSYRYQALRIEADSNRKLYDDVEQRIKEAGINGTFQSGSTHISDEARPPLDPVYPKMKLDLALALGISLILGISIAVIFEMSNDKIRSIDEVQTLFRTDVLGAIPHIATKPKLLTMPTRELPVIAKQSEAKMFAFDGGQIAPPIAISTGADKPSSIRLRQYEEALRMLWSSFKLSSARTPIRSMMITSAMPEEGKTTMTMQIAAIHAMHDHKTLVIDADLRRPSVHRMANVFVSPGLADVVDSEVDWRSCVVPSAGNPNLFILPAGAVSARSYDEIVRLLPRLIAEAGVEYELVMVDAPPLLSFSESLHIASIVDGVMVVVCADQTRRRSLMAVLQTLARLRANVIGVALNKIAANQIGDSYQYLKYYGKAETA